MMKTSRRDKLGPGEALSLLFEMLFSKRFPAPENVGWLTIFRSSCLIMGGG